MQPAGSGSAYGSLDQRGLRWDVDAGRLWRGAVPTALVAVGVTLVGLLVVRDLLGVPVLRRSDGGELVQASTTWYVVAAIVATVLVTGLLHALLLWAPNPWRFYSWIGGLAVTAATLLPFTFESSTSTQLATALLHLLVGCVVLALVRQVGGTAAVLVRRGSGA